MGLAGDLCAIPFHPGSPPRVIALGGAGKLFPATLTLGFTPPETGDKDFLIEPHDCDKEFLIGGARYHR